MAMKMLIRKANEVSAAIRAGQRARARKRRPFSEVQ